jgi:alanine racemase
MNLSCVEVQGENLRYNVQALRSLCGDGQRVAGVVKGNAYGHGMREVVQALNDCVDAFQIDDIEELRELRPLTDKPIWVFGYVPKDRLAEAINIGAELGVWDAEYLSWIGEAAKKAGKQPSVHLKIDALLGRLGTLPNQVDVLIDELQKWPSLQIESAYAHFANIEDTTDLGHATAQSEAFEAAFSCLRRKIPGLQRHLSATSGLMTMEQAPGWESAWVRLGIGMYGMYPSAALSRTHGHLGLKPALRWVSHLAQFKELPARHPVGYGLTYFTGNTTRVGIVPLGYSDGFDRGLSNSGEVLVGGQRCPVIGRVAMNMFAVDLSGVDAKREDEVVLLGEQDGSRISAEEVAACLSTINYEITARISPSLPRVLV